jgi:putative holliday junction resolvase
VKEARPIQTSEIGRPLFKFTFPRNRQSQTQMGNSNPPAPHPAPQGANSTILAFDFGEKRMGTAIGDTSVGIAHPLGVIDAADKQRRYAAIAKLIDEWRPARLVVGLPAHADGVEHEISRLARKFARDLGARFGLPVELIDERLTSAAAESSLDEAGVAPHKRKALIDCVAAQHILQAFLNGVAGSR